MLGAVAPTGASVVNTAPRIAEEMRRCRSSGAAAPHDNEGLPRRIGRGPDPQLSDTVGTQTVIGASTAMTSDGIDRTLGIIIVAGFGGEVVVPWAIIGLSNWMSFDVPFWALGPMFGGPIMLALVAALMVWLVHVIRAAARARGSVPTTAAGHMIKQREPVKMSPGTFDTDWHDGWGSKST